jgi:F-type H+-transporting ATPase subunit b
MLRARYETTPIVLSLALLACGGAAACAEEKAAHGEGHGHRPAVYEAEIHDPATDKTTTKTFDLNNPADAAELAKAVGDGHVHEMKVKEDLGLRKLFSLAGDLGLWSLVVFLLLLYVLSKMAWPKMIEGLKKREDRIRTAQEEAVKARDEAHAMHLKLQKELDEAHLRVKEIIDSGRRDAQALREEEMAKTKADIQVERDRLHREIESETDRALQRIWTQAADLATQASAKALGRGLDGDAHRRLIDEALADLRRAAIQGTNGHA